MYREYIKHYRHYLRFISYCPMLTISALKNQRVSKLLALLPNLEEQYNRRLKTGVLGRLLDKEVPTLRRDVKYISQVAVRPPTFLVKARGGKLHFSKHRQLVNVLRKKAGFSSCALRMEVK